MASEFTNSTSEAQVLINNSRNIMAATSTSDDAEANLATGYSNQFWNFYYLVGYFFNKKARIFRLQIGSNLSHFSKALGTSLRVEKI